MSEPEAQAESQIMEKGRVEAFSDGVFAIAITLLVLEIHVPEPDGERSLATELARQWPSYLAYVVSFLTIGIIWMNHHATLRRVRAVDHVMLLLNLLLLLLIGLLPWTTELIATYLRAERSGRTAAAVYGGSFLLVTAAFYAMQRHILWSAGRLTHDYLNTAARHTVARRARLGLLPYVVATAAAAISPYLTIGTCALIAVYYALPVSDGNLDRKRGRHPML